MVPVSLGSLSQKGILPQQETTKTYQGDAAAKQQPTSEGCHGYAFHGSGLIIVNTPPI